MLRKLMMISVDSKGVREIMKTYSMWNDQLETRWKSFTRESEVSVRANNRESGVRHVTVVNLICMYIGEVERDVNARVMRTGVGLPRSLNSKGELAVICRWHRTEWWWILRRAYTVIVNRLGSVCCKRKLMVNVSKGKVILMLSYEWITGWRKNGTSRVFQISE